LLQLQQQLVDISKLIGEAGAFLDERLLTDALWRICPEIFDLTIVLFLLPLFLALAKVLFEFIVK
jgi:hypothetical protein